MNYLQTLINTNTNLFVISVLVVLYCIYYLIYRQPHIKVIGKYDIKKKKMKKPPPPYPNGWYNLMRSQELGIKQVKNVDIAGQNMVVFRAQDGIVHILQAYCLHMGAHLGVGGQVKNSNCIQCPFHGWLYDGRTGKCVDHDGKAVKLSTVQYDQQMCREGKQVKWKQGNQQQASLRKYPASQINGYIYVWIHAMPQYQKQPLYYLPDITKRLNQLSFRGTTEHIVNCHIQDIPQNGADTLHFKYVHTYIFPQIKSLYFTWQPKWRRGDHPDIKQFFQHPKKQIRDFKQKVYKQIIQPFSKKQMLSIGNLQNQINIMIFGKWFMFSATIIQIGLPIVFVILKSPLYQLVFHHYIRPHGPAQQYVYHDLFISNWIPYFASAKISELEGGQVTNDMYVWQAKTFAHKRYLDMSRNSDQYIEGWLTWASQHYEGCKRKEKSIQF